jgi:hypothetical protein
MGYLYEVMDRAKEVIYRYHEDKGEEGLLDEPRYGVSLMSNGTALSIVRHVAGLYLNPAYSYACGFRFDAEVMDGFF